MQVTNFIQKNKFFLLSLLLLLTVILVNLFPKGYVFGGGDTNQFISSYGNFKSILIDWMGAGFFYGFFYGLTSLGISYASQLSFYLGFIIFGSFISFWIFARLLFKNSTDAQRSLTALFYALNLNTLFLFTGNWGYSYFPSLYVFIPILIGLLIKFATTRKGSYGAWFCLVSLLGSSGFGNPAFAFSFVIFCLIILFSLWIFGYVKIEKYLFAKTALFALLFMLIHLFWILPLLPQTQAGVEGLTSSTVLDFETVLRSSSGPIAYIFSLMHFSDMHFPQNFYYKNFMFLQPVIISLAFLPIILILSFLSRVRNMERKKRALFFVLLSVLVFFIILITKVRPPFEAINTYIFHIWGFSVLRGYDKTAIFVPFLIASLLLLGIIQFNKKWIYVGIALALLAPLPFYAGKLQQTAGYRVSSKNDYTQARMSFLTKIPSEYYSIQDIINLDPTKARVATLPATFSDGSGITYFPKWEFYGVDITQYLYKKKFIEANGFGFPNWKFASTFSEGNLKNNSWIIKLLGMMNVKYIIYHKDAPEDAVGKTISRMRSLEKLGAIQVLEENDYFILYLIKKDYFVPYIAWQRENVEISTDSNSVGRGFEKMKNNFSEADIQETNHRKFIVTLDDQRMGDNLILAETFNPLWRAYAVDKSGTETEIKNHFLSRGYANGWKIDNPENISQIVIEYYPIRLMWRGMAISLATVLLLIGYLAYDWRKRKQTNNDQQY